MAENGTGQEGPKPEGIQFTVAHQKVELDINFDQQVKGKTEITIYPETEKLKKISLNARQCHVSNILINRLPPASVSHQDPCDQLALHFDKSNVHHWHLLSERLESSQKSVPDPNLVIGLPRDLSIQPVDLAEIHDPNAGTIKISHPEAEGTDAAHTTQGLSDTSVAKYTPLTVVIEFSSLHLRDAVQFVIGKRGSGRWPHAYTRGRPGSTAAAALFPCIDSLHARCTWDIDITCARTVGDAISQSLSLDLGNRLALEEKSQERSAYENKEMLIACTGKLNDESINKNDACKKTASFSCSEQLSAQQIGFAIGPFEKVNLNSFRDSDDVSKLGENAVSMFGYCLPGRNEELTNTCLATTKAVDAFVQKYIACPTHSFSMCFVEDMSQDVSIYAGAAMCSTRMLHPEEVIDPAQEVTRKLVHAIASQWSGINIIPEAMVDTWVTVGMAHYMTDLFMRDLCGNNEHRYRIRKQADKIFEMDQERPSLHKMGDHLHIDPSIHDFMSLKAPVVLFILDRRIHKSAGASKMPGIIGRILTRARTGELENNAVSTDLFQKTVERFYHASIKDFMEQWIFGAGCPRFQAYQRFNKKKLVVEMTINQVPPGTGDRELDPKNFLRDVREEWSDVFAEPEPAVFTGPMTIRIHEADGTPYEHIVQIREARTTIEVPYNTKYKRLKRSKRQRTKPNARTQDAADDENDALVYCLGDTLQSDEEVRDWKITEWTPEDEERMNAESYEWIRLDADFEWIARIEMTMPGYMYSSQVQQDRDVVAQLDAIRAIAVYGSQSLVSSILVRTLMDRRYFHGIRTVAAQGLVKHATEDVDWIGLFHLKKAFEELFCVTDSNGHSMTRPNDFSDQQSYLVQCAILDAISQVRDKDGKTPNNVKDFLLDKLKFNDNSSNPFSDAFYVSKLMSSLTTAVIARKTYNADEMENINLATANTIHQSSQIEASVIGEIDRYRRMDEWNSSFQNLYSRSALECQSRLSRAGVSRFSPLHFLQYTRPGNHELLRKTAYEVLITPNVLQVGEGTESVLKYIVHCMVADSSPFIRNNLQGAFAEILAKTAIGDRSALQIDLDQAATKDTGDIVMEDTSAADTGAAGADTITADAGGANKAAKDEEELARLRRTSIPQALRALKKELGNDNHDTLSRALWRAVNYSEVPLLEDLKTLLDFCAMLYTAKEELKVDLKLPRYWKVEKEGKVIHAGWRCSSLSVFEYANSSPG